jgi:hypothetical protein
LHGALLTSQILYHRKTAGRYASIEGKLHMTTIVLFALAVYGCLAHAFHWIPFVGWFAPWSLIFTAALPALAAALHGIATHAEFPRLERRYVAMAQYLQLLARQMEASTVPVGASTLGPFSRDQLLGFAGEATTRMIDEVAEWRWLHAVHDVKLP